VAKKAKQWKSIGLPPAPEKEHGEWFERVLQLKDERQAAPLLKLADEYNEIMEELDIIDVRRSELTATREALDRIIMGHMDTAGLDQIKIAGQTFSERVDVEAQVEDRSTLVGWVLQTQPELVTVNAGHIKSIVKEAMDPEVAAALTVAQRQSLKVGDPGSGKLPPGVKASYRRTLGRTLSKR